MLIEMEQGPDGTWRMPKEPTDWLGVVAYPASALIWYVTLIHPVIQIVSSLL